MLSQLIAAADLLRDVTDNKTDNNQTPYLYKDNVSNSLRSISNNSMNDDIDILCREDERLKTFARWPIRFIDMQILAQTGLYYMGREDHVKCYFCGVEIGRWEVSDHPVQEHLRWSTNCPLLRRRPTNNIPINAETLDSILPPLSYDVCGANEIVDVRPAAFAESSIASPSSSNYAYPDYPEYAIESARLRSFAEWPRTMKQKPKELAEAGFFYTGVGDRVKCFSCGGGLKDWNESDDPWEQHAIWLFQCPYLKLIKGQSYILSILKKNTKSDDDKTELNKNDNNSDDDDDDETSVEQQQQQNVVQQKDHNNQSQSGKINVNSNNNTTKNYNNDTNNSSSSLSNDNNTLLAPNKDGVEKKFSEDKLCKICYASEYNTAFLPCGHVVACAKCASSVTKCPMCRKPFTDIMRVYFS